MNPSEESLAEVKREHLIREAMRWENALKANAYGILMDWAMAEDAFQETLILLNQKWAEYEDGKAVLPWARQIIKFKALNMRRKAQRQITV
ncbi:MAG: RNA polymerase sigma factor [Opitutales bacterium]